jgi:hypothetical protein
MKKFLAAIVASVALMGIGCQSVESAKVDPATIASNGEAVAIVQCTALGFSALFHFITITEASIDTVVNKMMIAEAKALGGNKVQLLSAMEIPTHGLLFRLPGGLFSYLAGAPPMAQASGIAVK